MSIYEKYNETIANICIYLSYSQQYFTKKMMKIIEKIHSNRNVKTTRTHTDVCDKRHIDTQCIFAKRFQPMANVRL